MSLLPPRSTRSWGYSLSWSAGRPCSSVLCPGSPSLTAQQETRKGLVGVLGSQAVQHSGVTLRSHSPPPNQEPPPPRDGHLMPRMHPPANREARSSWYPAGAPTVSSPARTQPQSTFSNGFRAATPYLSSRKTKGKPQPGQSGGVRRHWDGGGGHDLHARHERPPGPKAALPRTKPLPSRGRGGLHTD